MSQVYIKRVELRGIHKRYNLDMDFNESLNILYGQNGTGKSTLIHIIANVANCDFVRFAFIDFDLISVLYSNGATVLLKRSSIDKEDYISVFVDAENFFVFSVREAFEAVKAMKEDSYDRDYEPVVIRKLSDFIKRNELQYVETSYFPAFRTMLEAWSLQRESGRVHSRRYFEYNFKQTTNFSRNLFGEFLPTINYPSPIDIENNIRDEIRDRQMSIARYETSVFSDSFIKIFSALLEERKTHLNADELLEEISQLTAGFTGNRLGDFEESSNAFRKIQGLVKESSRNRELKNSASGALLVYRDALKERQSFQQQAFKEIDAYCDVVNSFLDKKELSYSPDQHRRVPRFGLRFPDGTWSSIRVMSSGERQLLTMLYAVNKMSGKTAVLIDEPEISLHIDWQEDLLGKMMQYLGDRQIIVCTHSPAIAADFNTYMKEVSPDFIDADRDGLGLSGNNDEDDF